MGNLSSVSTESDAKLINIRSEGNKSLKAEYKHPAELTESREYVCDSNCQSVAECASLQRLIHFLKVYKNDINLNTDKTIQSIMKCKPYLLNDYHHILNIHLNQDINWRYKANEQFQIIYKAIFKKDNLLCKLSECNIYSRNHRQRETTTIDVPRKLSVYTDILDAVHCFFMHSEDVGYRTIDELIPNKNEENKANDIYSIAYDHEIKQLKAILSSKRQTLQTVRGQNRFLQNKFMTHLTDPDDTITISDSKQQGDVSQIVNDNKSKVGKYSFGSRFDYWQKHESKYKSLKIEIMSNKLFSINLEAFMKAYEKAEFLLETSDTFKKIASNITKHVNDHYGVADGVSMQISNVLAVILYTDYDVLSNNFSKTFRKLRQNESDQEIKEKNREYWNWSKILVETVNCFGTVMKDSKVLIFYHGITQVYFSAFIAEFNSPTSTTTSLAVAMIFAQNNGLILELKRHDFSTQLRYFNCSFISNFGNEEERLFFQPPAYYFGYCLQFVSIRNIATNENYKQYVTALTTFEKIVTAQYMKNNMDVTAAITIILSLLNEDKNIPIYIVETFKLWKNIKTEIKIRLDTLPKCLYDYFLNEHDDSFNTLYTDKELYQLYGNKGLNHWMLDPVMDIDYEDEFQNICNNVLAIDRIIIMFENVEKIICKATGLIDKDFHEKIYSVLSKVNNLSSSKLHTIDVYGRQRRCRSELGVSEEMEVAFLGINWDIVQKTDIFLRISRRD